MYLRYLKYSAWRYVICCIMSWCLAQMCFLGFYVNAAQQYNHRLLLVIVLVLNGVLWLVSFGKKTMIGGVIGFVAALAVCFVALRASGNLLIAFTDKEDQANPYIYYMICFAVVVGLWLLTGSRRGTFASLIIGVFVAALIQFLYSDNRALWLILYLAACFVALAMRNYRANVLSYDNRRLAFGRTAAVAIICVVAICVVGCGVFYGIITRLNPPVQKIRLLEKDMNHTFIDRFGLATAITVLDPDLKSDQTESVEGTSEDSDGEEDGDEDDNSGDGGAGEGNGEGNGEGDSESADAGLTSQLLPEYSEDATQQMFQNISLPRLHNPLVYILLTIAILIVVAILLKIYSHRLWLKRLEKLPRQQQINRMYHLFLRKFRQIREGKNREETPYEYARREEVRLASFITKQTDFSEVTDIFVRSEYGVDEIGDGDYAKCVEFYENLFRLLRQYLGLRWILMFFVL